MWREGFYVSPKHPGVKAKDKMSTTQFPNHTFILSPLLHTLALEMRLMMGMTKPTLGPFTHKLTIMHPATSGIWDHDNPLQAVDS